jgi:hypothetical protein
MKFLRWVVWILIAVAVILMVIAGLSLVFQFNIEGINKISYFHAANSMLLLAIAIFLVTEKCCTCCDKPNEVK